MGGYQQLVRGEPFRGKFRNSFERPEPLARANPRPSTSKCRTSTTRSAKGTGSWSRCRAPGSRWWIATRRSSWTFRAGRRFSEGHAPRLPVWRDGLVHHRDGSAVMACRPPLRVPRRTRVSDDVINLLDQSSGKPDRLECVAARTPAPSRRAGRSGLPRRRACHRPLRRRSVLPAG